MKTPLNNYLNFIQEGGIFVGEKSTLFLEELEAIVKIFPQVLKAANEYRNEAKKFNKEYIDQIEFEVEIKVDPQIKSAINKEKRGKSFITIRLFDGNNILDYRDMMVKEFKTQTTLIDIG